MSSQRCGARPPDIVVRFFTDYGGTPFIGTAQRGISAAGWPASLTVPSDGLQPCTVAWRGSCLVIGQGWIEGLTCDRMRRSELLNATNRVATTEDDNVIAHRLARPRALFAISAFVLATILISAIVLTDEVAGGNVLRDDLVVAGWVQAVTVPGVGRIVGLLNWLGSTWPLAGLTVMIAVALAARRRWAEALLLLPALAVYAVNWLLKDVARSPRPTEDYVRISDPSAGFGFPSGHTMAMVVVAGLLIYVAWRVIERPLVRMGVQASVVLLVAAMGFSRVYSGAHWPSDVLGGVLWGSFYTALIVVAFHLWATRRQETATGG